MRFNVLLCALQLLLAVIFLCAGAMKLFFPRETLALPIALPWPFIRLLGAAELLGAAGLVLPWFLGIRPVLTPVAAAGLMIIVTGATVITLLVEGVTPALFPLVLALLSASVAYGRWPAGQAERHAARTAALENEGVAHGQ